MPFTQGQTKINATDEHNGLFEDVSKLNVEYVPGGCALNTLRVAKWMLSNTDATVKFSGEEVHMKLILKSRVNWVG